jgi:hypothetical protein
MAESRDELLLRKLNGEDVELEPPMSRIEKLYYKLLGYDIEIEPPQSREEVLLKEYIDNGGGGGGGGDVTWAKVNFINADTSTLYFVTNLTSIVDTGYFETISGIQDINVQDESEVTVPLYNGKYAIHPNSFQSIDVSFFPQVTGGVTLDMESQFIVVTGDGTITFKGSRFE